MSNTAHAAGAAPCADAAPRPTPCRHFAFRWKSNRPRPAKGAPRARPRPASFRCRQELPGFRCGWSAGTLRELHWHANAAEWAYVVSGNCRITVYSPSGKGETLDFGPGDVWYFPRGHGHSIQGIGPGDCHFILLFDNGYFSEFATFSFSDWIGHTPCEVLAKNLKLPESTLEKLPTKEVYFAKGPVPPPLPRARAAAPHRCTSIAWVIRPPIVSTAATCGWSRPASFRSLRRSPAPR